MCIRDSLLTISSCQTKYKANKLDFLIGNWERINDKKGQKTYEIWNTNFTGLGITLKNKDTVFKEILSIVEYESLVTRLFVDNENNLWVSTFDNGVDFYSKSRINDSNKITFLEGEFSFVSTQDYMGGLWFYSRSNGLGYMKNQHLKYLQGNSLSPNNTIELTEDNLVISDQAVVNIYELEDFTLENQFTIVKSDKFHRGNLDYDHSVLDLSVQKNNKLWVTGRLYIGFLKNGIENKIDIDTKENYVLSRRLHFGNGNLFDSLMIVHNRRYLALISEKKVISKTNEFNKPIIKAGSFGNKIWVSNLDGLYIYSIVNNKIPENGLKIWDNRVFSLSLIHI